MRAPHNRLHVLVLHVGRCTCHSRSWSRDGKRWLQEIRDVSRHRHGCHKHNHGCRSGRGLGRGRHLIISLRASVGDGLVVAVMSGGSHRHSHRLLLVPPKCTKSPVTSPPRGASHTMVRRVQHQPCMSPAWVSGERSENKPL